MAKSGESGEMWQKVKKICVNWQIVANWAEMWHKMAKSGKNSDPCLPRAFATLPRAVRCLCRRKVMKSGEEWQKVGKYGEKW